MRLYEWLDNNKNKDNVWINFLRLMYSVEVATIPHLIISVLLSIFIPIIWEKSICVSIILCVILIAENIGYWFCEKYHTKNFKERKFASDILDDQSSLVKSINILMYDSSAWKTEVFKKTCDMVCAKLHERFMDVYKCDIRTCVEYTFEKEKNEVKELCTKMAGRCSKNRSQPKKAMKLSQRSKYFSYRIFNEKLVGINYLNLECDEDKIKWYRNPANDVKVIQYIGLADSLNDSDVTFILQIDFLDKFKFGEKNTEEEIRTFVNAYLKPYVNIINMAYLLGRNKKGSVGEV